VLDSLRYWVEEMHVEVRDFWRSTGGTLPDFATRISGSRDLFGHGLTARPVGRSAFVRFASAAGMRKVYGSCMAARRDLDILRALLLALPR
jgi:hypothetical protein